MNTSPAPTSSPLKRRLSFLFGTAILIAAYAATHLFSRPPSHPLDRALTEGAVIAGDDATYRLRGEHLNDLTLSTGQLVILDPVADQRYTLTETVPPGTYPLLLMVAEAWPPHAAPPAPGVATGAAPSEQMAYATLQLTDTLPATWEPAAIEGQPLVEGEAFRFSLKGDSPALLDAACLSAWETRDDEAFWNQVITQHQEHLHGGREWSTALASLDDPSGCTVLFLYSAARPGRVYLGRDRTGAIACITLDFERLPPRQ